MAAEKPRVHVLLERPVFRALSALARRNGVSLSLAARDLIREAIELHEDLGLGALAERRRRTLGRRPLLTHDELVGMPD